MRGLLRIFPRFRAGTVSAVFLTLTGCAMHDPGAVNQLGASAGFSCVNGLSDDGSCASKPEKKAFICNFRYPLGFSDRYGRLAVGGAFGCRFDI